MKKFLIKKESGSSTLEILLAFAILILSMSAVIMVGFGNQSVTIDSETNAEAIGKANESIEKARADSRENFFSVFSSPPIIENSGALEYEKKLEVLDISPCKKEITSFVSWNSGSPRPQEVKVSTILTSIAETLALGGDCDTSSPAVSNWESPKYYETSEFIHPGSKATDVDVIKNNKGVFALMTTTKTGTMETFWIADVTNPSNPILVGKFDTGHTLNGIDTKILGQTAYAFLASASTTAQLQVLQIDFSNYPINNPSIEMIIKKTLPGVGGSQPQGTDLFYYNRRIYIGTRETAGNEFHVFEENLPSSVDHIGSVGLNHSVYEIVVQGNNAYIAASAQTSAGCELIVIDISNPALMVNNCFSGSPDGKMNFRAPGNFDGTAIEIMGNKAYLGRKRTAVNHDFYILNISDTEKILPLGSVNLGLNPNTEVAGIKVRGELAFLATTDQNPAPGPSGNGGPFMVYNISDPENIFTVSTCPLNFSEKSTGLDFLDDTAYVTNEANNALRIIYPSPSCSI